MEEMATRVLDYCRKTKAAARSPEADCLCGLAAGLCLHKLPPQQQSLLQ